MSDEQDMLDAIGNSLGKLGCNGFEFVDAQGNTKARYTTKGGKAVKEPVGKSTSMVVGSLSEIAAKTGGSLAETFCSADVVVIVDTSGSMGARDSRRGESRYHIACEELAKLQVNMPGKLAVIAFSERTVFCPSGVPEFIAGGTNLAGALKFAKIADIPPMRFIVISDGQPDSEEDALCEATAYQCKIDCVYVGPEDDIVGARKFLEKLANAHKGKAVVAKCADQLAERVSTLLLQTA